LNNAFFKKTLCNEFRAMVAIIKKKGELAIDAERYAMNELYKTTKSLNCKRLFLL
jgi:hypothetical protein